MDFILEHLLEYVQREDRLALNKYKVLLKVHLHQLLINIKNTNGINLFNTVMFFKLLSQY